MSDQQGFLYGPVEALYNKLIDYEKDTGRAQHKGSNYVPYSFWSFLGFSILAILCIVSGIRMTTIGTVSYYALLIFAEVFVLGAIVSTLIFVPLTAIEIGRAVPEAWKKLRDPHSLLKAWSNLDDEEFRFVSELRNTFDTETLKFLAKRLPLHVNQLRDNYGMIVGSPSQLKIFTVLLALVVQLGLFKPLLIQPFIRDNIVMLGAFSCIYLLVVFVATGDQGASQRIEKLAQMLELAADQKDN